MYKLVKNPEGNVCCVIKDDKLAIPMDEANTDYQAYLKWLEAGNTPEAAS